MRKLILLIITLSLVATISGVWAQSRVPLVVIASEGPAQVILSGRLVGVANPRLTSQVAPGNYELLVRKPGLPGFRQRITVGSGGLTINAPLGGASVQPAPQPIQPIQSSPQPIQPIQPVPQPIQPTPQVFQPQPQTQASPQLAPPTATATPPSQPAIGSGMPVTLIWHAADTADVYINGVPIKAFDPDYRTRRDEAPLEPFQQSAYLKHGDVITVGTRRGGSHGFMMVAVDTSGKVLLRTGMDWRWYDGSSDSKWYEPSAYDRAARKGTVSINASPWGNQNKMVTQYGPGLFPVYATDNSQRTTNLYYRVSMPGTGDSFSPPSSGNATPASSGGQGTAPARGGPSGASWTKVLTPQWPFIFLAEFPDGSIAVASDGGADVYVKDANDTTLQKRTAPQTAGAWASIRELFVTPDGNLTVFANQVGVLRSSDKGLAWTAAGTIKQFNYPFVTKSGILLTGDNAGQTQRSADGGQTWQKVLQGAPQGPFAEAADGSLYVQHEGKLKHSTDQGRTWIELSPTASTNAARILPYGSELILQTISESFDGARTTYVLSGKGQTVWESLPYLITHATQDKAGDIYAVLWKPVYDLFFPDALVRSEDGGKTYQPFMKGLPEPVGYINIWQAPYSGGIYVTADGGPGGQALYKLVY